MLDQHLAEDLDDDLDDEAVEDYRARHLLLGAAAALCWIGLFMEPISGAAGVLRAVGAVMLTVGAVGVIRGDRRRRREAT